MHVLLAVPHRLLVHAHLTQDERGLGRQTAGHRPLLNAPRLIPTELEDLAGPLGICLLDHVDGEPLEDGG
jgi:hypothetical protein